MPESAAFATQFVGRTNEIAQLSAAWERACSASGSLTLIQGEGGIGKTRLSEEVAAYARAHGGHVVWGRCYEGEGAPGFWPWIQVARELRKDVDASALGSAGEVLGSLVPGDSEPLVEQNPLGGSEERFRLSQAVNHLLAAASQAQPLLLILEDLHWADEGSLKLLEFVSMQGGIDKQRILILATYRGAEPDANVALRDSLARLTRGPQTATVHLKGFSESETSEFVSGISGSAPDERILRALLLHTDGNPFVIGETVRLGDGNLTVAGIEEMPWRDGLLGPMALRLSRLDETSRDILECAAVLGREFSTSLLSAICGLNTDRLLEELDRAEGARIVQPMPGAPGRYRFVHALLRESLYGEMLAGRKQRLHFRAAEALEAMSRYDVEEHLSELVRHFVQGAALGGSDRAVAYSVQLGQLSLRQYAYETAAAVFAQAFAVRQTWPGPPAERAEILLGQAEALRRMARPDEARPAFLRAAEVGRTLAAEGNPHGPVILGRAALGYARARFGFSEPATVELLAEALSGLEGTESPLRSMVMVSFAQSIAFGERRDEARSLARRALHMAREHGDRWALGYVLDMAHTVLLSHRDLEARLLIARELIAIGEPEFSVLGRRWAVCDLMEMGNWDATRDEVAIHAALAETLQQPMHLWYAALFHAMSVTASGDMVAAEAAANQALVAGQRCGSPDTILFYAPQLLHIRREQGRGGELEPLLTSLGSAAVPLPVRDPVLAMLRAEAGQRDEAAVIFDRLTANACAAIPDDNYWLLSMYVLAETCAALNDEKIAAELFEAVSPFRGRMVVAGNGVLAVAPVSYTMGVLALVMNRLDEAATCFAEAAEMSTRWNAGAMRAHALYGLARSLAPDDRTAGVKAFTSARTIAGALSMTRLLAIMENDSRFHTEPVLHMEAPAGLSPRELQVLAMVAAGQSNQAIADTLVLSLNTVIRHVSNIYRKIDVTNRSEATAWAMKHGIRTN